MGLIVCIDGTRSVDRLFRYAAQFGLTLRTEGGRRRRYVFINAEDFEVGRCGGFAAAACWLKGFAAGVETQHQQKEQT